MLQEQLENSKNQVPRIPVQENLKELQTNQDLANWLGLKSVKLLTWLSKTKSTHYSILRLVKKGEIGKFRIIHNPDNQIRLVQYLILTKILDLIKIPDYIYAFEAGKSIPEMTKLHVGKKVIVSMDLKDFFPSIKQVKLFEFFKGIGIGDSASITLSELCTYKSFVPQGALTSPKISNIITANTFGPEVKQFCDNNGYTLTIYADDITISSDEHIPNVGNLISTIQEIVQKYGFRVNYRKTKVMPNTKRQWVCGVVTNVKTNMLRSERLRLRAIVHNIGKNGIEVEAAKGNVEPEKFVNVLQGRINWFRQLNPELGGKLFDRFKEVTKHFQTQPTITENQSPALSQED